MRIVIYGRSIIRRFHLLDFIEIRPGLFIVIAFVVTVSLFEIVLRQLDWSQFVTVHPVKPGDTPGPTVLVVEIFCQPEYCIIYIGAFRVFGNKGIDQELRIIISQL